MAKKKTTAPKTLTQKQLKDMLAQQQANLAATQERLTQAEETYKSLTTPSEAETIDPDLVRSKVTGLSAAQQEAKDTLISIAQEQGGGYLRTSKSAGEVVAKPTTTLPPGQEWKWFPTTGGGGSWKAVQIFTPGSGNGSSGGGVNSGSSTGSTTKTTYTAPDGRIFTDLGAYNAYIAQIAAEDKRRKGQSAFDLLFSEFDRYGMGALLNDVKNFIVEGLSRDELVLKLRATPAYEKRFAANAQRIKSGLRSLSEAEYIGLEDQYQSIMRQYGLPQSYYARGDMGRQEGFEKFIAGDVSPVELEDRISKEIRAGGADILKTEGLDGYLNYLSDAYGQAGLTDKATKARLVAEKLTQQQELIKSTITKNLAAANKDKQASTLDQARNVVLQLVLVLGLLQAQALRGVLQLPQI